MSEQFLYWNCKRTDGYPAIDGTWLAIAFRCLQRDGCCLEADWAYVPTFNAANIGQGPPPAPTHLKALPFRLAGYKTLAATSVADIKAILACEDRCVAFSIPVFNSWYRNTLVASTGNIIMPVPGEARVGGHAMCIVGYQDDATLPAALGGGRFLIRNSWGTAWGVSSVSPGYGTIPYAYIAKFCIEAFSIA